MKRPSCRLTAIGFFVLSLLILAPQPLADDGIGYRGWGIRGGLTIDPDQGHVGAHLDLGEFRPQLRFVPNIEIGFGDDRTVVALNAETYWVFRGVQLDLPESAGTWRPYLGGGLALNYTDLDLPPRARGDDSDTELGVNVLGGVEHVMKGGNRFMAELKIGVVDSPDFKLTVGVTF